MPTTLVVQLEPEKPCVCHTLVREDQLGVGKACPLAIRIETFPASCANRRENNSRFVEFMCGKIAVESARTIGWKTHLYEIIAR